MYGRLARSPPTFPAMIKRRLTATTRLPMHTTAVVLSRMGTYSLSLIVCIFEDCLYLYDTWPGNGTSTEMSLFRKRSSCCVFSRYLRVRLCPLVVDLGLVLVHGALVAERPGRSGDGSKQHQSDSENVGVQIRSSRRYSTGEKSYDPFTHDRVEESQQTSHHTFCCVQSTHSICWFSVRRFHSKGYV